VIRSSNRRAFERQASSLLDAAAADAGRQPATALPLAERAYELARQVSDKSLIAQAARLCAEVQMRAGTLPAALERLGIAERVQETAQEYRPLAECYILRAMVLINGDYYAAANATCDKGLRLPELRPRDLAKLHACKAMCAGVLVGMDEQRRMMLELALPAADASRDDATIQATYHRMAAMTLVYVYAASDLPHCNTFGLPLPKLDEPVEHYRLETRRHIERAKPYAHPSRLNETIFGLSVEGSLRCLEGRLDAGLASFEQALDLCRAEFSSAAANIALAAGMSLRATGDAPRALEWLERVSALPSCHPGTRRRAAYELALVYEMLGRTADALASMRAYSSLYIEHAVRATTWLAADDAARDASTLRVTRARMLKPLEPAHVRRAARFIDEHLG